MPFPPLPDFHMHTPRCNHATGSVADYARAAVSKGLKEIGMSDHSPMPGGFDKAWRMDESQLAGYIKEVEQARDEFASQLTIRVGLEADYHPGSEAYVADMIAAYDWDYVIGSVHYIGDWGFDNPDYIKTWDDWDIDDAYVAYFDLVAASAATGLFDIIGHPDLVKKFGHRPSPDSRSVADAEERMLQSVLNSGAALEISSAGLRKPVQEIYPHQRIVARAAELGIGFAFGSDAHAPNDVGHGMDECINMLEANGIKAIASFQQRQRTMVSIRHD
jgi:histidinol-phosphatase (PHP family)